MQWSSKSYTYPEIVSFRWWLCLPVTLALLVLCDWLLSGWYPHPSRLPEQFSPTYLSDTTDRLRGRSGLVVVLGDSVLWGYRIQPEETAVARLAKRNPTLSFVNLSYEGGSMPNSFMMLRYLLLKGVRPQAILINVNVKEMNPADSAYRRLLPSLQRVVAPVLSREDRRLLESQPMTSDASSHIGAFIERFWRLYAERVDIREALFGSDDLASAALMRVQEWTGSAALAAARHQPTPDKFLGTYDLTPLDGSNVGFTYLSKFAALVSRERIPTIAFLTPTNHLLLHDYIDVADYDQILRQIAAALSGRATVVNLDHAMRGSEFIDNDHLTPAGNVHLASLLQSYIGPLLR